MGLTVIRAIVNMSPYVLGLDREGRDFESTDPIQMQVDHPPLPNQTNRFEMRACDIAVPWVRSAEEFDCHHLRLYLVEPTPSTYGAHQGHTFYTIWQQSINGVDLVRFSQDAFYVPNARGLAASREGTPLYEVQGDSDCSLVVDERAWVILIRLAR